MRKRIVAGNWKMNKNLDEARALAGEVVKGDIPADVQVILAPPFPFILPVVEASKTNSRVAVAAQNCSNRDKGAFTGEVSASMIRSCGAEYVIIGHSERRLFFKEDSAELRQKLDMALANGLSPIYCVGEMLEERQEERAFDVVKDQLEDVLYDIDQASLEKIVVAYEPVWAIGTGHTATSEQAQEMHAFIRETLTGRYGKSAGTIPILYGGSCNAQNAAELFACDDVDGGLIGGASLDSQIFLSIINSFKGD
jgi:triosephosphate isomerase (TIM)